VSDFGPAVTDDQWNRIRQIVHDEALRARAVESFPPVYRPLLGDATNVPTDELLGPRKESIRFGCRSASCCGRGTTRPSP
jgi:hypothetical protein